MAELDFTKEIANIYLFYGEESFKKRNYRDKLRAAVTNGNDMNFAYFEGKNIDFSLVYDSVVTMPFFADKRLVIVENSGKFKAKGKEKPTEEGNNSEEENENESSDSMLEKILNDIPKSTILAFFEEGAAKNKKIVKTIEQKGKLVACEQDSDEEVIVWLAKGFAKANKKIRKSTIELLLSRVGNDYDRLRLEYEKIVNYVGDREVVEDEDIMAISSEDIEAKVFDMLRAITEKNPKLVLEKYYDLLANRAHPLYILAMIRLQFRTLIQTAELRNKGLTTAQVAKQLKKQEFIIKNAEKYLHNNFKMKDVRNILEEINDTDMKIKMGDVEDQIGVEMLLVKFSSKNIKND